MKSVAVTMVVAVSVGVAGCAADTGNGTDTGERVGQTSQAINMAVAQSQHDAQRVLNAILSHSTSGLPSSCTGLQSALNNQLFPDLNAGSATITNEGTTTILGLPAIVYSIQDANPFHSAIGTQVMSAAVQCFLNDTYITNFMNAQGSNSFGIDPGPAQLTQNLSATRGSSAAATDSTTGSATTAWQWPTSPSTGGAFAGGEPCSSVALSTGQNTSASILKSGSSLQYSSCK